METFVNYKNKVLKIVIFILTIPLVSIIVKFLFNYGRIIGTYIRHIYSIAL